MRIALACLLAAAVPALAQVPEMKGVPAKGACADCGVVRSVRPTHTETAPSPANDAKPSGLVATVPLGRTEEKARIGPSQRVGKDVVTRTDSWEVTILLDDGRVKLMRLTAQPDVREGDKVLVDKDGKIQRR